MALQDKYRELVTTAQCNRSIKLTGKRTGQSSLYRWSRSIRRNKTKTVGHIWENRPRLSFC